MNYFKEGDIVKITTKQCDCTCHLPNSNEIHCFPCCDNGVVTTNVTNKVEELKRLQKEIDEANAEIYCDTQDAWNGQGIDYKVHSDLYSIVESNTERIREIILNEL